MSNLVITDISKYYNSLDDAKSDGYTIVKVSSVVQFYTLSGRKTVIIKENFEPIIYVLYVIFSPQEEIYYLRSFNNIPLEDLYFYEFDNKINFESVPIENLRRRVFDGNVYLLMRAEQVEAMKAMLARVSKANLSSDKTLRYLDFIRLCDVSLKREWFNEYKKSDLGYKTQLMLYDKQITEIWQNVK